MSVRRLRAWVFGTVGWLIVYALAYAYGVHQESPWASTLKDLTPIAIAIPGAVLAAGFNRRNSYLQAMRELWRQLIPAAQSAIQYTHLQSPTQQDFAKTQEALSSAIDLIRGVFANVPKRGVPTGLYPYENLKDIQMIVSWLGFGSSFRASDSRSARACITRLWQEMHVAMLCEFDRDVPLNPVSKYLSDGRSVTDLLIKGDFRDDDISRGSHASDPRAGKNGMQPRPRSDHSVRLPINDDAS